MKIGIIIAAAGSSSRMTLTKNKLTFLIQDVPVIVRTIRQFLQLPYELEVVVVSQSDYIIEFKSILHKYGLEHIAIIKGGVNRRESVRNGIKSINELTNVVIIHDGARPFVRSSDIIKCIEGAKKYGVACLGVKSKDTMKIVDKNHVIVSTPKRENLYHIQTPQCFLYKIAREIHEFGAKENMDVTDDAKLAEILGYPVTIIEGHYDNIKITTDEDISFATWLLSNSNNT